MPLYCTEFIFDGISSKEYDMIICSFDGSSNGETTAGSNIEFTTFKAPNSNKWVKTSAAYNEQLSFTFQICKYRYNQTVSEPISERELAFFMRWLVRKDYKYLQFIQEGFENIFYNCQINVQKYEIGGECYGLTLTATCDAPFGWSEPIRHTLSSSTTATYKLYDSSDEIGVIYPDVEILSQADNQDITISNEMTGTQTIIQNCKKGEQILLSEDKKASSSECIPVERTTSDNSGGYSGSHNTFFNDFNWKWFSIGNTFENRVNKIIVTGNCDIQLSWRAPRKAVV